jgi:hypothetical protein
MINYPARTFKRTVKAEAWQLLNEPVPKRKRKIINHKGHKGTRRGRKEKEEEDQPRRTQRSTKGREG